MRTCWPVAGRKMMADLPSIPWEPQVPREPRDSWTASCTLCGSEFDASSEREADDLAVRMDTEAMAEALRKRGYVVYKKRPHMRGGKVRLANGTVLVQTGMDEVPGT